MDQLRLHCHLDDLRVERALTSALGRHRQRHHRHPRVDACLRRVSQEAARRPAATACSPLSTLTGWPGNDSVVATVTPAANFRFRVKAAAKPSGRTGTSSRVIARPEGTVR
jgi:hypothetical protein